MHHSINYYQADGFVRELTSAALREANRQIASARNATPEAIRGQFRSGIRSSARDGGYRWFWVVK